MRELGKYEEELHRNVGKEIIRNKIDVLITVGNLAKYIAEEAEKLGLKQTYKFKTNENRTKDEIKSIFNNKLLNVIMILENHELAFKES